MKKNTEILTYCGILFDLDNFKDEDISILDIAHALSNICRFNGHCKKFYSVAEHCVRASNLTYAYSSLLHILLHDASEAYLGDVVTPLKNMIPFYIEKESELMKIIFDKWCIVDYNLVKDFVNEADREMLNIEFQELFSETETDFGWSPEKARREFLSRFYTIIGIQ